MVDEANTESEVSARPDGWRGRYILAVLLVGTALAVVTIGSRQGGFGTPSFDMLAYLDQRTGHQEASNDVKCWSSMAKLQMFLTGMPIDSPAVSERIDGHMQLIESIWTDARGMARNEAMVDGEAVQKVLLRRFPHQRTAMGDMFDILSAAPITIQADALTDYSDTIEPWRLLQTWAVRCSHASKPSCLSSPFDEDALLILYSFLRLYDLALLQHARVIAHERKQSSIDAAVMAEAFGLEARLRH